jgi:hypothetical protein
MCKMLNQRGPTSPSREAETLVNRTVVDAFFCEVLANLQPHLEHKVALERAAEIQDL